MKKTWALFRQDIKLSLYGLYFYVEIIMAVAFVGVMLFLVPENFDRRQTMYVHIALPEQQRELMKEELRATGATIQLVASPQELEAVMSMNRSASGLIIAMDGPRLSYEVVLQGHESARVKRMIKATLEGGIIARLPSFRDNIRTTTLSPGAVRLSDRDNIIPIFLTMNVALMGLFIIAAYVYQDKEEGVVKALAVTPLSIGQYLASKMLLMLAIGLVSSLAVVAALMGGGVNYLWLIALVASSNLLGSALGLLLTSFFDTLAQSMEVLYSAMLVLMLASLSYLLPAFSPWWVRVLPTYTMLFAFRELLLPAGDLSLVLRAILQLLGLGAVIFSLSLVRYSRRLTV